jgi:amino acid adenylation domain-containing protein
MLVHRWVEDAARHSPDAVALIEPARQISYAELERSANRCAHLLRDHGVRRGDRVVIALENSIEMVSAYLGALKAGATAVPMAAGARNDRLAHAVVDCSPRAAIIDSATARHLRNAVAQVPCVIVAGTAADGVIPLSAANECPDHVVPVRAIDQDLAAIIYTSGSTGEPRGVMLTHRNFVSNARSIVSYLALTAADRVMCVLPFHYVYGLSLLHTHIAVGGSIVIENRSAFPNVVLNGMRDHQVTGFSGVPSTFALMLHRSSLEDAALPSLRYVTVAGGALPPSKIDEWLRRGPHAQFFVMYGATEASARLTYLAPSQLSAKRGSIGRPIPNVEIVVLNEAGETAAPREVGELVARGSNISCGYWNNPCESALRFTADGYRTGDLGYVDEDGYLFLAGRQHDMIKVGANRVGLKEIEDVLHAHPAVDEAAVIGAPHEFLGEAPVAFVALNTAIDDPQNTLRAFCAPRLEPHKVPLRIITVDELPKLPGSGKLDRQTLRGLAADISFEKVS